MTEQELQQALAKASGFAQRQGLLKQLWKLRWRQGQKKEQLGSETPVVSLNPARRGQTPRIIARVVASLADD